MNYISYTITENGEDNRVPIYKGCINKDGCGCSGACREIIGWRDKIPGEL